MFKNLLFLVSACCIGTLIWAQNPSLYWSFDGSNYTKDRIAGVLLNAERYKAEVKSVKGLSGNGLSLNRDKRGTVLINGLNKVMSGKEFTMEYWFKGQSIVYSNIGKLIFRTTFQYDYLQVIVGFKVNGKQADQQLMIPLKGAGIESYDYLTNGEWHHLVIQADAARGFIQVYIDGETVPAFKKSVSKASGFITPGGDGFADFHEIDELAFYNQVISPELIKQHYFQGLEGKNYTFNIDRSILNNNKYTKQIQSDAGVDPLEFAPGYPNYTIQATDQLKSFPDPRYSVTRNLKQNFSWADIRYLHRELPGVGGNGFGATNPAKAVELVEEMAKKWNYYIEIPIMRTDTQASSKLYHNPGSLEGALIHFAKSHPEYKTAGVLMQIQTKPVNAGFDKATPYATSQDLPDIYYMRNGKGKPIVYNNKKWFSPFAPLDYIRKDAETNVVYLRQVFKSLGRPIDMLNDNGEIFGHMRRQELLDQDPLVKNDQAKRKLSVSDYNGWFQNMLDTCYKNYILRKLNLKNTLFTFYNVSAYNNNYWPGYRLRRTTNFVMNGNHYSTPSFYPARPDNWRMSAGPQNGYGSVAEGRMDEIALGDKLFAPFVSAGWSFEKNNIRPAQWLALLKSMVMLGAEFFHVGYFNVTGTTGWPDGKGPFDPRGYIYQIAMPSYAQAIASRIYPFLTDGKLLNPQASLANKGYAYRFKGIKENHLIQVRKLGNQYLINGSIQPNSNIKNNVPNEEDAQITIEGRQLKFKIRRQGSMYILDLSSSVPVFYQIDGWHQFEHPFYWSKDILLEAENAETLSSKAKLLTEKNSKDYDFRIFTSFVSMGEGQQIMFSVPARDKNSYIGSIRLRTGGISTNVILQQGDFTVRKTITAKDWTEIVLTQNETRSLLSGTKEIIVRVERGKAEIDWLKFQNK